MAAVYSDSSRYNEDDNEVSIDTQPESVDTLAFQEFQEAFTVEAATTPRRNICVIAPDEYGVYRDEEGNTHAMESRCQKKTYKKYLRWQIAWEVDILAYHNMKDTFRCPKSILTLLIQRNL